MAGISLICILLSVALSLIVPLIVAHHLDKLSKKAAIGISIGTALGIQIIMIMFFYLLIFLLKPGDVENIGFYSVGWLLLALLSYLGVFKPTFKDTAYWNYGKPRRVIPIIQPDGGWKCPRCGASNLEESYCSRCGSIPIALPSSGESALSGAEAGALPCSGSGATGASGVAGATDRSMGAHEGALSGKPPYECGPLEEERLNRPMSETVFSGEQKGNLAAEKTVEADMLLEGEKRGACPGCGARLPEAALFCAACGRRIPLVCPVCGVACSAEQAYCHKCGTKLNRGKRRTEK